MSKLSRAEKAKLSPDEFRAYMKKRYVNKRFGDIDDPEYVTDTTPEPKGKTTGK